MRHTISLIVQNHAGVLVRIAELFSARGYNLEGLTVGATEDRSLSRMTLVTRGDDRVIEQVTKQLNKLIDVIKVNDLTKEPFVERELLLLKVDASGDKRPEIMQIVEIFRAKIVDMSADSLMIEMTGRVDKVDALISMLRPFGMRELARSGVVGMKRDYKSEA
jgi:acetolactate synthase I/III small subunit